MINVKTNFFLDWPYDEALLWMNEAKAQVKQDPHLVFLACGSHRETIISLGRHCSVADLILSVHDDVLIRRLERGGGITAHEPGQLVLYPVLNLRYHTLTIAQFVTGLEMIMINFLTSLGFLPHRSAVSQGVFLEDKKLGFIGLRLSDHVTSHGLAINVLNEAHIFSAFHPCGIKNLPITTAKKHGLLHRDLMHYAQVLVDHSLAIFSQKWE